MNNLEEEIQSKIEQAIRDCFYNGQYLYDWFVSLLEENTEYEWRVVPDMVGKIYIFVGGKDTGFTFILESKDGKPNIRKSND